MNGQDCKVQPPVPTVIRHCLPRSFRLDPAGYKSTFDNGESIASRSFVMWIVRIKDGTEGRVGTVASKRTFHDAVDRNRAKRLLREAYRKSRGHLTPGVQLVLLGRRKILDATGDEVLAEFSRTCKKAKIWKDGQ